MKHWRFIVKIISFVMIVLLVLSMTNTVLIPKYLYDNPWPTTQTFTDFYRLEKNSIDVIFLGSSVAVSSFSPLHLYQSHKISSYNLGSEQQNLLTSYYWLREALRYQSPEVVVLETSILFPYIPELHLNSDEATHRKAFDFMRWSSVKTEAIADICQRDPRQTELSYYLPNIRFHTRWAELEAQDITFGILPAHPALMGYSLASERCGNTSFRPFDIGSSQEVELPVELMKEYLDKLVQLCREKEIELILVTSPKVIATIGKYNYLKPYADEQDIQYLDFGERSLYEAIGFDFPNDSADGGHLNVWGAEKITAYLGDVLVNQYGVATGASAEHEKLSEYFSEVKAGI